MSNLAIQRAVQVAGSQEALAQATGVTQGLVSQWVRGKTRVTPERAAAIEEITERLGEKISKEELIFGPAPAKEGEAADAA